MQRGKRRVCVRRSSEPALSGETIVLRLVRHSSFLRASKQMTSGGAVAVE